MRNIIGILLGTDTPEKTTQYAVGVNSDSVIVFSIDISNALRFETIEEAKRVFTTSSISFRKLENGQLQELSL